MLFDLIVIGMQLGSIVNNGWGMEIEESLAIIDDASFAADTLINGFDGVVGGR